MALIELKLDPSRRELRVFGGVLFPAFFLIVGAMTWQIAGSLQAAVVIWTLALVISAVGLIFLPFMRAVYVAWMYAVYPIGWTLSHLMFALVYYLLFTPFGLVMRILGRDPLGLRIERSGESYWVRRKQVEGVDRYFRQI